MKVAIIYFSNTGNTEAMAKGVEKSVIENGAEAFLFKSSEFPCDMASEFDAFAFGCPAYGTEELDDTEFLPMWDNVKAELGDKKVALFGSYGWGGGEYMNTWVESCDSLNIVATCTCEEAPDESALEECANLAKALV